MKLLHSHTRRAFELLGLALLTVSSACVMDDESDDGYDEDLTNHEEQLSGMTNIYQAEARTFQSGCTQSTASGGYTGTGFMDFGGKGSIVEWNNVNVPAAGPYTLVFRYANGSSGPVPSILKVNENVGNAAVAVPFVATGAWTKWRNTNAITVNLKAGNNKLRVTASTSSGGPHLDKLEVRSRNQCAVASEGSSSSLSCPGGQIISSIDFASYGAPTGTCGGGFSLGTCNASNSLAKVNAACLGKNSCSVLAGNSVFGDPCSSVAKQLKVNYTCSSSSEPLAVLTEAANRPANLLLLAGQSNMEGTVDSNLLSNILTQLDTAPAATRADRVSSALSAWYLVGDRKHIGADISNQFSQEEALEVVRLQDEGLVGNMLTGPGRKDVMCSWQVPGQGTLETRQALQDLQLGCGKPFGPELILGQYLGDRLQKPTSLIKVAKGGTTLYADWLSPTAAGRHGRPVGPLYTQLAKVIAQVHQSPQTLNPACSGSLCSWQSFIWFQGENDVFVDAAIPEYEQNLRDLITDVRAAVGDAKLPVVVVQVGYWASHLGPDIATAQATVAAEDPNVQLVKTDDLSRYYHYDPAAQMIIGERVGRVLRPH